MVVVALLSVDLVESVDLVSVELVVNCIFEFDTCLLELVEMCCDDFYLEFVSDMLEYLKYPLPPPG